MAGVEPAEVDEVALRQAQVRSLPLGLPGKVRGGASGKPGRNQAGGSERRMRRERHDAHSPRAQAQEAPGSLRDGLAPHDHGSGVTDELEEAIARSSSANE
jgi:hypothetical protein